MLLLSISLELMKIGETLKTVLSRRDHWKCSLQVLGPSLAGVSLLWKALVENRLRGDFEPCSLKFLGLWVKSALPSNIALHASLFGRVTQSAMA